MADATEILEILSERIADEYGGFCIVDAGDLSKAAVLIRSMLERERKLEGALAACLPYLEDVAVHTGYGFARPDNPHDFSPDRESCTEEEIAAHKAACEAYDRGEYDPAATLGSINGPGVHLLRAPWGIGSYTMRDEQIGAIVDAARAILPPALERP